MCEAVKTMSEVANGNYPASQVVYEGIGELAAAIDDFDASIIINPLAYDEGKHRRTLEESLESIISGAALLADSRYDYYDMYMLTYVNDTQLICLAAPEMTVKNGLWPREILCDKRCKNCCPSTWIMRAKSSLSNWMTPSRTC